MEIKGVIIAGGESSRFGTPKAFATWKNQFFYQHMIRVLQSITTDIYILSKKDQINCYPSPVSVLVDDERFKGMGPLAGLYTAMDQLEAEWYVVLPIDMPLLHESILYKLTDHINPEMDAVVAKVCDDIQPLVAIYNRRVKRHIYEMLTNDNRAMYQLLKRLQVHYIPFTKKEEVFFKNINTTEELHTISKTE
ncbi:molybdenum cofactor guanylyltransferase [Gracilibacillus marinus]|uniref:Probable molybdenum cofactor guanylyltransferase n=1 Tax=Gracilibacillus marinus TaxID=630535 RepID=A0ABV8VRQ5_9BACI